MSKHNPLHVSDYNPMQVWEGKTYNPTTTPKALSTNLSARAVKAPPEGYRVVSSPRDCMIEKAMLPMTPKPMMSEAGPPEDKAPPEPTSNPGPIIPASNLLSI